jgi:hypothetical protein
MSELERKHGIRWGQLVDLEPRVQQLLWRAREAGTRCRSWSDVGQLFSPLRNDLARLLGFSGCHKGHSVLGSLGAYTVAYWRLYEAVAGLLPRVVEAVAETTPTTSEAIARPAHLASDNSSVSAGKPEAKKLQLCHLR